MKRTLLYVLLSAALLCTLATRLPAQNDQTSLANALNEVTVPEGTEFKLDLHTTINSKTARVGDRVLTTLFDPVYVEDEEVLPKGARVDGHISEVARARRRGKGGTLSVIFDTVELPNGQKVAIVGSLSEVFSSPNDADAKVDIEGDLRGGGPSRKKQAIAVVGATAAGAPGGVATGVAAGAAGLALALLLPHGKQAVLSAGSLIGMRLDQDVSFNLPPKTAANTLVKP